MLYTDNDVRSSADLLQIDSEVMSVAAACKPPITVDGPGSICELAWSECGRQILSAQQMYTSFLGLPGSTGGGYQVTYGGGTVARNQSRTRLNQVVASESQYAQTASPLQMWVAYTALTQFFRNASARLGKDRFEEKYDRYKDEADFAWRQLRQNGLPVLSQPMEAPGSKHGVNAGSWGAANLTTVAGGGTEQALQVAITYYDQSKYTSESARGNGESGPSATLAIAQAAGQVLRVSIASLNPPTGVMDQVGLSQGAWTPLSATHWIVWAGAPGGALYFQAAVPIGTKTYTLAGDPVLTGSIVSLGQNPEMMLNFQNLVGRG